jgi:hypothetical protein
LSIIFKINCQVFVGFGLDTIFFVKHHAWS